MTDALPLPGDARYLKAGLPSGRQLTDPQVVERVSAMLLEIERDGMDAVRRHSQQLDGWAPERFAMTRDELDRARDAVDPGVRERLQLGHERVKGFAELQLSSVERRRARARARPLRRPPPRPGRPRRRLPARRATAR